MACPMEHQRLGMSCRFLVAMVQEEMERRTAKLLKKKTLIMGEDLPSEELV